MPDPPRGSKTTRRATMERQPTRPAPVSQHLLLPAPETPPEDTLELHVTAEERETLERKARVDWRDTAKQNNAKRWEQTRPKPIQTRRKSIIQMACIRDIQYTAAAANQTTRGYTPKQRLNSTKSPSPILFPSYEYPLACPKLLSPIPSPPYEHPTTVPKLISPIRALTEDDWRIDLRQLLTPRMLSPIPDHDHLFPTPPQQNIERLFSGVTIKWKERFSRTYNKNGELVLCNVAHGRAYLRHMKTKIEICQTKKHVH